MVKTDGKGNDVEKERLKSVDIAKGIGIILVVWAHTEGPGSSWIYQFHMPLFFLISGYLFNSNTAIREFVVRKIKSLYLPFVIWNLAIILIRTLRNLLISSPTTSYTIKAVIKTVLLLDKDNQFFGATWFLGALFIISVLYKCCDVVIEWKYKRIFVLLIFVLLAAFGFAVSLPYFLSRTLILGMFFAFGHVVREQKERFKNQDNLVTAMICFILFMFIATHNTANMGHNTYTNPILFVFGACMASYFTIWVSAQISRLSTPWGKTLQNGLILLGKQSLDIVIWQFVFFRLVIAVQLMLNGQPLSMLLDYYPILSAAHGWWIVYTLVGIVLPILWCELLRLGPWGRVLKRIHAV